MDNVTVTLTQYELGLITACLGRITSSSSYGAATFGPFLRFDELCKEHALATCHYNEAYDKLRFS